MQNQKITDNSKLNKFELLFLIIVSSVTITFVSACSPLYPFNPWDDVNVFFVLGRGIVHGLVPYRDLFDHKGPLLHFVFALAAIISENSFIGIWIIECILASVFAIFSWKTAKLFIYPSKFMIMIMPVFIGVIYTIRMFNFGGNAEELCFPLLSVEFYLGLRSIVQKSGIPDKNDALICGIITGAIFWIKYSFLGFVIGFCLYIFLITLKRKEYKKLWDLVWRFLLGIVIVSIPIVTYFIVTKSLGDLWEAYFKVNLFMYHEDTTTSKLLSIPVLKNFLIPIIFICRAVSNYPTYGVMLILAFLSLIFIDKAYRKKVIIFVVLTFSLTSGFIFSKTSAVYYYGYILTYCFGLGLITLIKGYIALTKVFKNYPKLIQTLIASFLSILYVLSILLCKNMYLIFQRKEMLTQFQIAEIVKETPDAKVLVYDSIDPGIFTASGIMPANRFFCYLNIEQHYHPIKEEQDNLIAEGYFDYIITTFSFEEDWDNYGLYKEITGPFTGPDGESSLEGYKIYIRI